MDGTFLKRTSKSCKIHKNATNEQKSVTIQNETPRLVTKALRY